MEPAAVDWCRAASRMLWIAFALLSPFVFVRLTFVSFGPIAALLTLIGLFFALRFLSPVNLFALFHLFALFNPLGRRDAELVPVRYVRVREDGTESEIMARFTGNLSAGNVMPDDRLTIWGPWKGGVVRVTRALSHRTRAAIEIESTQSWTSLAVAIVAIAIALMLLSQQAAWPGSEMSYPGALQ